jgi:hypothetical protein
MVGTFSFGRGGLTPPLSEAAMETKKVYTKRGEADGVGKAGETAVPTVRYSMAYLELHGYVEDAPDDGAVKVETGAMASPSKVAAAKKAETP